jgi:hypothetical protein
MSEPKPRALPDTARTAASPPELPPHVYADANGLDVRPHNGLAHSKASIVWGMLVFTNGIAPAAAKSSTVYDERESKVHWRGMWTTSAFLSAGLFAHWLNPTVVSYPTTWSGKGH